MVNGWRAALRIARREAWRAKGRSTLVAALIGLPVMALAFAAVSYDSFRLTSEQALDRTIGAADALVQWEYDQPVSQPADGLGVQVLAGEPEVSTMREPAPASEILAMLAPGSRAVPLLQGEMELRTMAGTGVLPYERADLADPIHTGRIVLLAGRAPATGDEVALTGPASRRLGASIGDSVEAADGSRRWRVVGLLEYPDDLRREGVVGHPGARAGGPARTWLVETATPVTWEEVRRLNEHGLIVRSRAVILDPPPPERVDPSWRGWSAAPDGRQIALGVLVGGLAVLEVVLLAGPAFAVGARRRQRELALVAVTGGTPAQQRRIVLADGLVLGLIGAVTGIVLGTLAAVASLPLLAEHLFFQRPGGVRLWPPVLVGVALLAVVTGLLAAVVPAAIAARQNVVMALAGRRGVVRSRKRWLALGVALIVVGGVVATAGSWRVDSTIVLTGLIAGQLGLALCTPSLVGLIARAGRFLPVAPRIALRDAARNRAAAAPAISAVMAAVAGSLALGMFTISDRARTDSMYAPGMPAGHVYVSYQIWDERGPSLLTPDQRSGVRAAVEGIAPVERVVEVSGLVCPPAAEDRRCTASVPTPPQHTCPYWELLDRRPLTGAEQRAARADPRCAGAGWLSGALADVVVDDGSLLPALTGAEAGDVAAAAAVLRAGGVVVGNPLLVVDGQATVEFADGTDDQPSPFTVPAYALGTGVLNPYTVVMPPRLVAAAGYEIQPVAAVGVSERVPSQAQEDALNAALDQIDGSLWGYVERGYVSYQDPRAIILGIAAGAITLGAAGIATGLAAADRRPDLSTLGAVGASPRVRRLLSLSQSGVIAGLGALLGAVAGLGAALTILLAMNRRLAGRWPVEPEYPLLVPWPVLGTVLVVVPLVAMLGAGLLTRSRLPVERRLA